MNERIRKFRKYCKSFYSTNEVAEGVYPIATDAEIDIAIDEYFDTPWSIHFEGDSIDREKVREIIGR